MWIFVSIKSLVTSSNCISNQQNNANGTICISKEKTYSANFKRMKETPFNRIAPVSSVAIHTTKNYFRGFHNHCFSNFFFSFGIVWQTAFVRQLNWMKRKLLLIHNLYSQYKFCCGGFYIVFSCNLLDMYIQEQGGIEVKRLRCWIETRTTLDGKCMGETWKMARGWSRPSETTLLNLNKVSCITIVLYIHLVLSAQRDHLFFFHRNIPVSIATWFWAKTFAIYFSSRRDITTCNRFSLWNYHSMDFLRSPGRTFPFNSGNNKDCDIFQRFSEWHSMQNINEFNFSTSILCLRRPVLCWKW